MVSQHKQVAVTAKTEQLSSMPLSEISIDDSSPLVVHYGSHMPVAASTPTGTTAHVQSSPHKNSYQEIIPGIPQGLLYPTLSSLSSGPVAPDTNEHSLHNRLTKVLTSICKMLNSHVLQKLTILMILLDLQIHHQW